MVSLHIQDELVLGPVLLESFGVVDLLGIDFVTVAENLVQGEERRRHAASAAKKVAAGAALMLGHPLADLGQPGFIFLLLGRLGRRNEFLVRGDPRGDGRQEIVFRVEITLTRSTSLTSSK